METDYAAIAESIDTTDIYLRAAAASGYGIRILRQPLWEAIVSFIVSQNNNIPRIRFTMARLCGESADCPVPQQIAGMSDAELRKIGLGYRADYLLQAAAAFSSKAELECLVRMPYAEAREYLTSLRGIGPKVADCICLFGLHRTEAFPVDTWVRRIETAHYAGHFPTQLYLGVQGIMQQWMFAYERFLALHR